MREKSGCLSELLYNRNTALPSVTHRSSFHISQRFPTAAAAPPTLDEVKVQRELVPALTRAQIPCFRQDRNHTTPAIADQPQSSYRNSLLDPLGTVYSLCIIHLPSVISRRDGVNCAGQRTIISFSKCNWQVTCLSHDVPF